MHTCSSSKVDSVSCQDPHAGLVANRHHRLQNYERCFVGSEAVDYIMLHPKLFHIDSRQDAVWLGQAMIAHGLIEHVCGDHDFKDEYLFFRYCYATATP